MGFTYNPVAQIDTVTDARNNLTDYGYDGHDRLVRTSFPSPTVPNTASASDYEALTYEVTAAGTSGLVASRRLRDGQTILYGHDSLGRLIWKDLPGAEPSVYFGYDLIGRMTGASRTGHALAFTYDALGRNLAQIGPLGTVTSTYDLAGRRTRIDYPEAGQYFTFQHNLLGELTGIREPDGDLVASLARDDLGRRTALAYGGAGGGSTAYAYEPNSLLDTLTHNLDGTSHDQTLEFDYNPAGQITQNTRSNDLYSYTAHANVNRTDTINGLNQVTQTGPTAVTHDARGNITTIGTSSYGYDSENRLTSAPGGATLEYDPLGRLYQVTSGANTTRFLYDGDTLIGEYNGANQFQSRYVHGPGIDEPLLWYTAATRRSFYADERGSIVAVGQAYSPPLYANRYDEYGVPAATNQGRFQYTGQAWIAEAGLYYYRARMYNPQLGRFMQTDPIGYGGGMNLYAYVGGDPVNSIDPSGLQDRNMLPGIGSLTGRDCAACVYSTHNGPMADPGPNRIGQSSGDSASAATGGRFSPPDFNDGAMVIEGRRQANFLFGDLAALENAGAAIENGTPTITLIGIRRGPLNSLWNATPDWWTRFSADAVRMRLLENNLESVVSGAHPSPRAAIPARQIGLPGGRGVFYYRYEALGLQRAVPEVLSGARIAWVPGSNQVYFGPYHGDPGPGVPNGWILFHIIPDED